MDERLRERRCGAVGQSTKLMPQLMGSLSTSDAYDSDAWRAMVKFKRHLVLQLTVGQGQFWEAVNEVRQLRNIVPTSQVPPPNFNSQVMPYQQDVYRIRDEVIPERFYDEFTFDWLGFIAACLVYQPPRRELEEFAAFGAGPYPHIFLASGVPAHESPEMIAPPISEVRRADGVFHYLIRVDEYTTEADVLRAYRKIVAIRKKPSKGGAPKRDQLIAVQCAILYDEDNSPDPADKRRWRWTHEKLAKRFALRSSRAAKEHIEVGR
jgi:hypothetical protein